MTVGDVETAAQQFFLPVLSRGQWEEQWVDKGAFDRVVQLLSRDDGVDIFLHDHLPTPGNSQSPDFVPAMMLLDPLARDAVEMRFQREHLFEAIGYCQADEQPLERRWPARVQLTFAKIELHSQFVVAPVSQDAPEFFVDVREVRVELIGFE